jgi:hypothetical protein
MSNANERKFTVTLPENLYNWVIEEARERGVRKTTLITILVSECKMRRAELKTAQDIMEKMKIIPEEKLREIFSDGLIGQTAIN